MSLPQETLILCLENVSGEEVELKIEPEDTFQVFLDKAKILLGYEVDLTSLTGNQQVVLTDSVYQFLINSEKSMQSDAIPGYNQMLEQTQSMRAEELPTFEQLLAQENGLEYILNDGTEIRASQIHFDNEDLITDLTAENLPFVKYRDDLDEIQFDNLTIQETRNVNLVDSPVSKWSIENSSPNCSFINSLPFKLICNNINAFEAQFAKYLEANSNKTYATLSTVKASNKSPKSVINENFRRDDVSTAREKILNLLKDPPMTSAPCDTACPERRHTRKSNPTKLAHTCCGTPGLPYVDIDGVLIARSESQVCFICGRRVDNHVDKLYLFDKEDQRTMKLSPNRKATTQLKIICQECLGDYFAPSRMKAANHFLNQEEFLVIRNNHQYIFQQVKKFIPHRAKEIIDKVESEVADREDFLKVEIGSDGEIKSKPPGEDPPSDDVVVVSECKRERSSSDVEIVEPEPEIDTILDNLEEADEGVKEFLGKYQSGGEPAELKCRFCAQSFAAAAEVEQHCDAHRHELDDGAVFPCPLCDYGYATAKWLKGHLKAAHGPAAQVKEEVGSATSPIATRTRSAAKKDDDEKREEETEDARAQPNADESSGAEPKPETGSEQFIIKTEVKQEALDSSEDEIWIVQNVPSDAAELTHLLQPQVPGTALPTPVGEWLQEPEHRAPADSDGRKANKCHNCSVILPSAEALAAHRCRRARKRAHCRPLGEPGAGQKAEQANPDGVSNDEDGAARGRRRGAGQLVTCHDCNQSYSSKVRLKFHMQFHEPSALLTPRGEYSCPECSATVRTESELFDHVHFRHDKRRWACAVPGCGKSFLLRATLTKHGRSHTGTRRYVCGVCGKRFLDKQTLDEHGVTHLRTKPFQCHICLKQLTRRSRLRMHVRAHEEELALRRVRACAVCRRAFRDAAHAQEHAASECARQAPPPASGSPRQVSAAEAAPLLAALSDAARALIRVVEIEKAFRCEYCEDVFYVESALNAHRSVHAGVKNPFVCHICKVSFATYSRCTTHKTTHGFYKRSAGDGDQQTAHGVLGYGDFPVVKHFLCECGRSYLHWTYLQVHRRMKHAADKCVHACALCHLTFRNSWSLAYHRKKVHGRGADDAAAPAGPAPDHRRIPCRDCDELLPNKTELYRHRKKEHCDPSLDEPERGEYVEGAGGACPHCRATVSYDGELQQHVKSAERGQRVLQTGVRAWACGRCPKRFRVRSDLNAHLRLRHPATDVVLEMPGLNPSSEEVMKFLATTSLPRDKIIEITKISFQKGTTSIVPSSARALCALAHVPRTPIACKPVPTTAILEELPARCGRGAGPEPHAQQELGDVNIRLLLRDADAVPVD